MKRALTRGARALLAAGALGLVHAAAAQEGLPPISSTSVLSPQPPAPTAPTPSFPPLSQSPSKPPPQLPDQLVKPPAILPTSALPRAPERPPAVLSTPAPRAPERPKAPPARPAQETPAAAAVKEAAKPHTVVFAADQSSVPAVDLLAVPAVPSSWAVDAVKTPAPATRTSTPPRSPGTTGAAPPKPPLTIELMPPSSHFAQPPTAAPEGLEPPAAKAGPKNPSAVWAAQHTTAPVQSNEWPPAFVEYDRHAAPGVKLASAREEQGDAPPAAPIVPAHLQQKVARLCGGLTAYVKVVARPDKDVTVKVRPVNPSAEGELLDRLNTIPEMASPHVRVEIDGPR
jgi:hypothetical protein